MRARSTYRWIGVGLVLACLWPAAARAQTDEVVYFYTDAVGSVRMTTDGAGTVLARYDFHPFGGEAVPPAPPTPDVMQFAGKRRDAETGLSYFGARYYAGQAGRFTTVDPVLNVEAALTDPQRWNRYAYTGNNPLRRIDPDGRDWWDFARGLGRGAVDAVIAPVVLAKALVTDPVATGQAVLQDGQLLVYGLANPSEVIDQVGAMVAGGPRDHAALGRITGAALSAAAIGAAGRAVGFGAAAGGSAELSALRITFGQRGHGARHLSGTRLHAADVEATLMREIQGINNRSTIAGEFRGRTTIGGIEIEYRAFLRDDGSIHVGTYYPL